MDIKKLFGLLVICVLAFSVLSGCSPMFSEEDVESMLEAQQENSDRILDSYKSQTDEVINKLQTELDERPTEGDIDALNTKIEEETDKINELETQLNAKEIEMTTEMEETNRVFDDIELEIGDSFGNSIYNDGDIKYLLDTKIRFDGDNYDIHEEIQTTTDIKVMYSLIDDEEFGATLYIGTEDTDSLKYLFVFEDALDVSDISRDEPLKLPFLGSSLTITEIDSHGQEFEVRDGESFWLYTGEMKVIGDVEVTLEAVTEDGESASFKVGSEMGWIDEGDDEEFSSVTLSVEKIMTIQPDDGAVKLVAVSGEEVYQTFEDGDSIIYDQKDKNAEWVYTLSVSSGELEYIGVKHNKKMDEKDDDFAPITEGEAIKFPNDYLNVVFDSTNVEEYNMVTMEFDDFETDTGSFDGDGIIFKSEFEDAFELDGEELDEIFAFTTDGGMTWNLAYEDDESDLIDATSDTFDIVFSDTVYMVDFDGTYINIDMLQIKPGLDTGDFAFLGDDEEDAESNELLYNGVMVGTREYDVVGFDGLIMVNPDSNGENDQIELLVPEDKVEVVVTLGE